MSDCGRVILLSAALLLPLSGAHRVRSVAVRRGPHDETGHGIAATEPRRDAEETSKVLRKHSSRDDGLAAPSGKAPGSAELTRHWWDGAGEELFEDKFLAKIWQPADPRDACRHPWLALAAANKARWTFGKNIHEKLAVNPPPTVWFGAVMHPLSTFVPCVGLAARGRRHDGRHVFEGRVVQNFFGDMGKTMMHAFVNDLGLPRDAGNPKTPSSICRILVDGAGERAGVTWEIDDRRMGILQRVMILAMEQHQASRVEDQPTPIRPRMPVADVDRSSLAWLASLGPWIHSAADDDEHKWLRVLRSIRMSFNFIEPPTSSQKQARPRIFAGQVRPGDYLSFCANLLPVHYPTRDSDAGSRIWEGQMDLSVLAGYGLLARDYFEDFLTSKRASEDTVICRFFLIGGLNATNLVWEIERPSRGTLAKITLFPRPVLA